MPAILLACDASRLTPGGLPAPHAISDELSVHEPLAAPGKRPEIWHAHALEMASEALDDEWCVLS
jgi:hypothetical protein